jgi:dinuclear metal center YbgI/SA1388 family protein
MSVDLSELTDYLDGYLQIGDVGDSDRALNGLQVENSGKVHHIAGAVDACQAIIDTSTAGGSNFLLVHHGLFWGGLEAITGRHCRRIRKLIETDTALYSAHIPLDVHREIGNNALVARMLGVQEEDWFGEHYGQAIGLAGSLEVSLDELVGRVRLHLGVEPRVVAGGPRRTSRVGIVTGGGGGLIGQAHAAGIDTFLTGEGSHHTYFDAEEWGMNLIYAGHYATETVGVRALTEHLGHRFDVPWDFVDHPTGL